MKQINLALHGAYLLTCSFALTATAPVMAADTTTQVTKTYQSSFDDYKPLSEDNLSDWKSINVPSTGSGHAKHSMAGMQHKMTPEQMANMPSDNKQMPAMAGIDHSGMEGVGKTASGNMKGMDHQQMKQDPEMLPMAGMDHSKMAGMKQDSMKSMADNKPTIGKEMPAMTEMEHSSIEGMKKTVPDNMKGMDHQQMKPDQPMTPMAGMDHSKMVCMDHGNTKPLPNSKSAMQPMIKENMPQMKHDEMAGDDHGGSDTNAMDHSKMSEPKPNDRQSSHEGAVQKEGWQDESQPHEHASTQAAEHAGMVMPSIVPAIQATPWQIIPNYHPMVVHFPIALTIIAFLLSIAAYARRSHPVSTHLAAAGHFTLWLAAIGAAAAVLFGWLAYNSVNHDDAGHAAMLLHRAWAVPTAIGLILLASWDAWKYRVNELISVPMLFLLFLLSQAIAVTGWLGGEVVFRHGIGVLSLPSSEISKHGQHHEHGGKDAAEHAHGMTEDQADENADERTALPTDEKGESHAH